MKDTIGLMLREAWSRKGNPECKHPEFHKEYSFSGGFTGYYICITCGLLMRMERAQNEVKPGKKSARFGREPQHRGEAAERGQRNK